MSRREMLAGVGADGTFGLPAGFDNDFGPIPLFNVQPTMPLETWSIRSEFVDACRRTAATPERATSPFG